MSVPGPLPQPAPPAQPRGINGCLALLLFLIGVMLLLPGICSLVFMIGMGTGDGGLMLIWVGTFIVAAFGAWLIGAASKIR